MSDDVPVARPASRPGPLNGVRVLDLSWHLAGPFCTMILADLGADVIKVEKPGSHGGYDPAGFIRHYYKDQDAHYMALNRNKRSITLDLKSAAGKAVFLRLASRSDVVFNNFRAGVMERLGLTPDVLRNANPRIISASLSAFGADGPYASRPGVDLVIQALSGGMSMTGEKGAPPVRAGIPLADLAGGMWTAIGILASLRARDNGLIERDDIDVSLLDGQMAMIPYFSAYYFLDGFVPGPQGSGGHSPTYGAFECADGRYVVVAVIDEAPWLRLCRALELADLPADPRFATAVLRTENEPDLTQIVARRFRARPSDDWEAKLRGADVPYARVNRLDEALADPQVRHRQMVVDIDHTLGDTVRFVGNPVKSAAFATRYDSPPLIGEHTAEVLRDAGLDESAVDGLRAAGVIM
jgi:CoA:oxalate CoA-transferase